MPRIAVIDDFQHVAAGIVDWTRLGPTASVEFFSDRVDGDALVDRLQPFEVVLAMRERSQFPRSVLERLPNLRLLATTGMANAAIDLEAAAALGIIVSGTPSGLPSTVEITWALILASIKRVPVEDRSVRAGTWQQHLPGDLFGKTLGLLGLGRLGAAMVPVARAFSMDVIAWSQNLTAERTEKVGVELVTKDDLLGRSDVLSIHLRLSERTTGLIGAKELTQMKPTAILVNTSRGPIVDESALVDALRSGAIGGAGIDVYGEEPVTSSHPLCALDNAVLTPHLGYASETNLTQYYSDALGSIAAYLAGSPIRVLSADTSGH